MMRPIEEQRVGKFRDPFSDLALVRGEVFGTELEVEF
jgi:hypothetical protein